MIYSYLSLSPPALETSPFVVPALQATQGDGRRLLLLGAKPKRKLSSYSVYTTIADRLNVKAS